MAGTQRTQQAQLSHVERQFAVTTWRYLRLAMIAMVFGLGVSILYEVSKAPGHCFQGSISAYYYTPVRGFLVGALVTIGACLVCLKGNSEREDTYLNLAGMFAPVVALVPTPNIASCASVHGNTLDRDVNIANNVFALLAVGLVGLVLAFLLTPKGDRRAPKLLGWFVAALVWLVALLVFWKGRTLFTEKAHYTAAILMFVFIFAVVVLNARGFGSKTGGPATRNRYAIIAALMLLSAVVIGAAGKAGWDYWVLAIETALITLFAVFWVVQTEELWNEGLRAAGDGTAPR